MPDGCWTVYGYFEGTTFVMLRVGITRCMYRNTFLLKLFLYYLVPI